MKQTIKITEHTYIKSFKSISQLIYNYTLSHTHTHENKMKIFIHLFRTIFESIVNVKFDDANINQK